MHGDDISSDDSNGHCYEESCPRKELARNAYF